MSWTPKPTDPLAALTDFEITKYLDIPGIHDYYKCCVFLTTVHNLPDYHTARQRFLSYAKEFHANVITQEAVLRAIDASAYKAYAASQGSDQLHNISDDTQITTHYDGRDDAE